MGPARAIPSFARSWNPCSSNRATNTIIGTTKQDAGNGKVLSPLAELPAELVPAEIVPAEAHIARAGAGNASGRFSPG